MQSTNPYLNFKGNTEEAFTYYRSVFGGEFPLIVRFRDFPGNMGVSGEDLDKVAHIALPLSNGHVLMGTDVVGRHAADFSMGNNYYIALEADSAGEAAELFDGLSSEGRIEMPLQRTEWAEKYGVCVDKFGVQWMVGYTGNVTFKANDRTE